MSVPCLKLATCSKCFLTIYLRLNEAHKCLPLDPIRPVKFLEPNIAGYGTLLLIIKHTSFKRT